MTRKLTALLAAMMLCLLAVGPVQSVTTVADPNADLAALSAPSGPTDESKVPHYFGPWPNWANSPQTLPDVTVTIDPAPITSVTIGNPLQARTYASDDTFGTTGSGNPGLGQVLVVLPTPLIAGTLQDFRTWNQTVGNPALVSADNQFHAYVLRATPNANEYAVVFDSGLLTVPPAAVAGVDQVEVWIPAAPIDVLAGDLIAFYGQGIPLDIDAGTDGVYYPSPAAPPTTGGTFVVGGAEFPVLAGPRTYSFAATILPPGTPAGGGATATATVGANGAVTGLTITNPGSGYTTAPQVKITSTNPDFVEATAEAVVQTTGAVTSIAVNPGGSGYTAPTVTISGGGATTDATAHALGGVDAVSIDVLGTGYKFPTVDFDLPDDPNGVKATGHTVCAEPYPDCNLTVETDFLTVTGVVVDFPGSGYATAPGVAILDGTQFDPVAHGTDPFTAATGTTTLTILSVVLDTFGEGYTSAPDVAFGGGGTGAAATATTNVGAITQLLLGSGGSGYLTPGGIKKFQDTLPGLTEAGENNLGQYIPVAVPDTTTFPDDPATPDVNEGADYYVIGVVQHRERMSSSLPVTGTLLREYVQLSTSAVPGKQVPLMTAMLHGPDVPTLMPGGTQALGVDDPHFLGPTIVATKDRAVRIVFYNLLPTGAEGDLFLPADSTIMGSGMGPMAMDMPMDEGSVTDEVRNPICTEYPKPMGCFKDNRATLHLHGGVTPWISDGTPHQWITPANESTPWPEGVSVENVPDMVGAAKPANVPDCSAAGDGCQTFYYTNQQSARLMFYHDHAWGITRLNVYAGEAAGYLITDPTEQKLVANGTIPADQIPLVIQDRTFVPSTGQLLEQDPTWDATRWGGEGDLWYHHVYMPAQNPGDPSGMSAYGRWMYGPFFWPPATPQFPPIANPYFDPACNLDVPSTWQYDEDPFCEPAQIPGTPNISAGMEQFNDTPIVNGTAYPTTTLQPQSYRLRILNAANDRFWNLQWYVADDNGTPADPTDDTEVALNAAEVAAAQTDPNIFPTPDTALSPAGPDWVQIGTEGGFLPAPVVVDGQQVTTWITDPTRFDVGNVDKHSLLLAPAERADVVVDFSQFAGKTLILYNDAPAAFPARVPGYDYYTGSPDGLTLPGYGPNTRTVMQVKIADAAPAPAFNLSALNAAFRHHADGSGVFEEGQHPIIVGQAAYNSAYGTSFSSASDCSDPNGTNRCDGMARINQQGGDLFRFDNLLASNPQLRIPLQPKAIHDEMNSSAFDEFGRMTANLGLEAVPATPALQNIYLYPYVAPPTEVIDATNLPEAADIEVTPISDGSDGTQIWKITHNGVDTHPIHFHLYDVQLLNRVAWDNIISPPDRNELGWKDTVRMNPLQDTYVALRPIMPSLPFEVPNSVRNLSPMMPDNANLDPLGLIMAPDGTKTTILNALVNFGWEYVYHCHILSHEEMDMMRPVLVAAPPLEADGLSSVITGSGNNRRFTISWNDNSITETSFLLQRTTNGLTWTNAGTLPSPLTAPNVHEPRSLRDSGSNVNTAYLYRVVAQNTVGYGGAYASVTAQSFSDPAAVGPAPTAGPLAPSLLTATLQAGPQVRLTWRDNATNEGGFVIERRVLNSGEFARIAVVPLRTNTGNVTFTDTTIQPATQYEYQVAAVNLFGGVPTLSAYSPPASTIATSDPLPAAPSNLMAVNGANQGNKRAVALTWTDNAANETSFTVQRATNAAFTTGLSTSTVAANAVTSTQTGLSRATTYYFRIRANNAIGSSAWVNATPFPIVTNP